MPQGEGSEVDFEFRVPPDLRLGVYANALSISHSPYEFTFDWAVLDEPETDDLGSVGLIPAIVVSRVRIPLGLVFDVLQTLSQAMSGYEEIFGEIRRPGEGRESRDE